MHFVTLVLAQERWNRSRENVVQVTFEVVFVGKETRSNLLGFSAILSRDWLACRPKQIEGLRFREHHCSAVCIAREIQQPATFLRWILLGPERFST